MRIGKKDIMAFIVLFLATIVCVRYFYKNMSDEQFVATVDPYSLVIPTPTAIFAINRPPVFEKMILPMENIRKAFSDHTPAIFLSSSYRTEQERLKNEMTLTFNVYNTLAQKLEQDKLRVQEETPVYTVIEPATVPLKASSPKKALILVGFVFLALFGCIGYLFVKDMFVAAFKKEETEA